MTKEQLKLLFEKMSIEEKIGQLFQTYSNINEKTSVITGPTGKAELTEEEIKLTGSMLNIRGAKNIISLQKENIEKHPHGIPMLFMMDIINGYETIFPIPLAQGCTFDTELAEKSASIAAREAAAAGIHITFSPMVDLVRDARWGRVMESTGEDSYLTGLFGEAMVRGYQGKDNDVSQKGKIGACFKHFAAYGASEGGRDYDNVEISERTLREDYLPAYKSAVDAGSLMAMSSFNTFDRIPVTANKKLLRRVLREEMGFGGVLISDYSAVEELVMHGAAHDLKEAALLAINAGVDIDMMSVSYIRSLKSLAETGKVGIKLINEAVMRVLELKNKLGLFENPYKDANEEDEKQLFLCREHRETAYEQAVKSFVLLKNENILPLNNENTTVYIGPYSNNKEIFGSWSFPQNIQSMVTIKEGVENLDINNAVFLQGCEILSSGTILKNGSIINYKENENENNIEIAVNAAKFADKVVLCLGEHREQSGEAASRAVLTLPRTQLELFEKIYAVNKNIVTLVFTGRPLELEEIADKSKALMIVWMPGTESGNAIADVLYGNKNPEGRLTMSFPRKAAQLPLYYNHFNTGRPNRNGNLSFYSTGYNDCLSSALYPFGYGLSYSKFSYSKITLENAELTANNEIKASVTVTNTGKMTGVETVQLYIQDAVGSAVRPVKMLKGYKKIGLQPGESKDVTFIINETMLRFYDVNMDFKSEAGKFFIYIGADSSTDNAVGFELM